MGLERLKIGTNIFHPVLAIGFLNFALMVAVLLMSTTIFARPSGVQMEFSPFREGLDATGMGVAITVTSEDVIYIDNRVVTLNELRHFLSEGNFRGRTLMVKADAKASMGRVADVLDLCRGIIGANVNVSTIL